MNSSTAFALPQQSRYSAFTPFPRQAAEAPYQAVIRALDWQTRGIFERLRDLFGWHSVLEMSQSELAKRIDCSKAKLIEVLYMLESAQLISVQRQRLSHKRMQINRYHLLAPVCADAPVHDQSVSQTENQEERKEKKASISFSSSNLLNQKPDAEKEALLIEAGLEPSQWQSLLKYPTEQLSKALALAKQNARQSVGAYALKTLKQGFFVLESMPQTAPSVSKPKDYAGGKYAAHFDVSAESEPASHELDAISEPEEVGLGGLDKPVMPVIPITPSDPHRQRWQAVSELALESLMLERGRLAYLKRLFKQSYVGFDADTCTVKLDHKQLAGLDGRFVQQFIQRVGMFGWMGDTRAGVELV